MDIHVLTIRLNTFNMLTLQLNYC